MKSASPQQTLFLRHTRIGVYLQVRHADGSIEVIDWYHLADVINMRIDLDSLE